MLKTLHSILFFLSAVTIFIACESPEYTLSPEELKQVDSLFLLQKDSIELDLKDQCDSIFLERYDLLVDSLKTVRQKEILDIIAK